jgi:putative membrane protein
MMWGHGWDGGWGWGMWLFGGLMMLLVVFGAIALVRYTSRGPDRTAPGEDAGQALRILDERFARGEIDADEYTRQRTLLRSP